MRVAAVEVHGAVLVNRYLAEPIDVGSQVAAAQAVFSRLDQKCIVTVLSPIVAMLLIALFAPAHRNGFPVGIPADSIVPTHRILGDRTENPSHVGVQTVPFGQLEGV